ncbi:right-handed parallel beta-helix repeat-containing protein [Bradyrhizobium sp.]|uniref:right-handed parallel beta-helix repeat-containing protein n=1 Tax=Bradyrhizobium sp. TaxID=376 RepID=UPI002D6F6822|nr:right-handed parallel beta-helix repeat-containing protein [Bradyrhizobium sp.]HZR72168.1 right-handed parallel beta-helix repeat-containing protein [Bradyrhizobium sp.]
MQSLSRRRVLTLASSFLTASPFLSEAGQAQTTPPAGEAVFDMASFLTAGTDADTAFAKALVAISKAASDAAKASTGPFHIVFNLGKNAVYRISRPLAFKALHGFELNGNGAQLINTARASSLTISGCSRVTVRDLTVDYDPLPFVQGTIAAIDKAAIQITVKVDAGYPDDPPLLASISDSFFKVMDRGTKALKAGARDFLSPAKVERISPGLVKVRLGWSDKDRFPSELPIAVGDTVTMNSNGPEAITIEGSEATSLIDVKLFASPGMGILENGGPGSTLFKKVSVVPGPRPKGATTDRLIATNQDGSHFTAVERGPTIEDCTYANTSDDAVNVHGFYYYVVQKPAPRRYLLSPKWDIGLAAGDAIESCEHATFRSLGRGKIDKLVKSHRPDLKGQIAAIWKGRSPTTLPDLIYDMTLQQDLPLKVGDSVTSLSRIGNGTAIRRSSFHACGRVLVKATNATVEDCQFTYSSGVALQAGSDIGFWSESGFAENLTFRNNRFTHSVTGANELTDGNGALGAIYVGTVAPVGVRGFQNNLQNRNVTIEGNHIDDTYTYAIFVSNTDGLKIIGNTIGQTFIRGTAFDAGGIYNVKPNSAILVGKSAHVDVSNNSVASGKVTRAAVVIDPSCDKATVHVANNKLT